MEIKSRLRSAHTLYSCVCVVHQWWQLAYAEPAAALQDTYPVCKKKVKQPEEEVASFAFSLSGTITDKYMQIPLFQI